MDFSTGKAESLGHLGLISATMKDSGLMEKIDSQFGKPEVGIRYGQRVAAMILNGLGIYQYGIVHDAQIFP